MSIQLKVLDIEPGGYKLDLWKCKDNEKSIKQLAKAFSKRYGASEEYYLNDHTPNYCSMFDSTKKSKLKGKVRIVVVYDGRLKCLLHELIHVIWEYGKKSGSGSEMNYQSQEWQAILYESLYTQAIKK